ncbi:hypothetical protein [Corynebacterium sp. H130]|uniref:hypothetical protein n=1 Tax=Corynebacterium sp. H130 TaxID=3133444 RepID=UPI0030984348
MHLYGVISLSAMAWLVPTLVFVAMLFFLEPTFWSFRRPRRWWFYVVALLIGATLTAALPPLVERLHLDALEAWPMITVPIAALWIILYGTKRSFDPFYGALCVVSGACLFVAIEALISGPGDGTGLWSIGFVFAWWFLGGPLAVIAIIQTMVWAYRK